MTLTLLSKAFWLVVLHFIADFHLQSDFVSRSKAPGASPIWAVVMTAHAALHGAMVAAVLGPVAGLLECVVHWLIDVSKTMDRLGKGRLGFVVDQGLHLASKGLWLALAPHLPGQPLMPF